MAQELLLRTIFLLLLSINLIQGAPTHVAEEDGTSSGSGSGHIITSVPTYVDQDNENELPGEAVTDDVPAPTQTTPTPIVELSTVRLLSEQAGLFVAVAHDGIDVHAKASSSDLAARFYVSYPTGNVARFESALYQGTYLIVASDPVTETKTLRCGVPSAGNDLFTIVPIVGHSPAAYKQGNCFLAFDFDGERHGPCGLTTSDAEVRITMI